MRHVIACALVALTACAGSGQDGVGLSDGGTGTNDSFPAGCRLSFSPTLPEANAVMPIRVTVDPEAGGVFTFSWNVMRNGQPIAYTVESSTGDAIDFYAPVAGIYDVNVSITGSYTPCPYVAESVTVAAPGANQNFYRLRAVPPPNVTAPPQEQVIQIAGGGDAVRDISLDPGVNANGTVRNGPGGSGVPAYVKFMPVGTPLAFTEMFTTATGTYATKLVGVAHDVIVIPQTTTLAPKKLTWMPTTVNLVVGPGTSVAGTVRNPAGTALAGAKVQLLSDGVPSTLGTTDGSGAFSLRADFVPGEPITVRVTPPAASGLPRLEATGAFTLGAMQIDYAAGLQTCDLGGTAVRRSATNQAGAKVTVVGPTVGTAGTVTAGVTVNATGHARVTATANNSGVLPSVLVPRSSTLSVVAQLGTNDFAVDALDTSACAVTTIDAAAPVVRDGVTTRQDTSVIGGIRIEATPVGALALAGAQTIVATSDATTGAFSLSLAAGGRYDIRFLDPQTRVARREELDMASTSVPADVDMPAAISLRGDVKILSSSQLLPGTVIQLLCAQCTGADAARPIAQTTTNSASQYRLAVPDPGTM